MAINLLKDEGEVQHTAIFAFDAVTGRFKAIAVNAAGELITTAGAGGGGGAITSANITRATAVVTGTGQVLTTTVTGYSTVTVDLTGATFAGLAWHFQVTNDGTNWFNVEGRVADNQQWERNPSGYGNGSVPKAWIIDVTGFSQFRIDVTAFTSGSCTFGLRVTALGDPRVVIPTQTAAADLRVEAWQGPPGSVAQSWRMIVTDLVDIMSVNADGSINVTDNAGSLTVDGSVGVTTDPVHVDGKGTAGAPSAGVVSVQGVASGTVLPVSDGGSTLSVDDGAGSLTIDGTVGLAAGANNIGDVDVLTLPALPAGTNNIGDVDVLTLPALPAGANNIGDVDVLTLPALVAGTARIGSVRVVDSADADQTSVKSTQTSRFLGTQDARDAGRVSKAFKATVTTTTASTTLISFARSDDGGTDAGGSTDYTVTAGKRFVVVSITVIERSTTGNTTATVASLHFRTNTAGAVAVGSPVQLGPLNYGHPSTAGAIGGRDHFTFGEGWEIAAGTHFGMTYSSAGWTTTTQVPIWDITILGYEY